MRRRTPASALLAIAALASGCGSSQNSKEVVVSAASSLEVALPKFEPGARYSFGGSDGLAAQIRAGAKPDVFVSANTQLPQALFKAGLAERPVVFATNRLVLAVPSSGPRKVRSLADLAKPGVTIAGGSKSVPIGAYTRQLLARLPTKQAKAITKNIRSNEPDVAGIVGKLSQGAVDAGFVYASDVVGAGNKLRAIKLPAKLEPNVAYAAVVVKGGKHAGEARTYVKRLREPTAQLVLRKAGFGPAP